jgi:hypothetical protein
MAAISVVEINADIALVAANAGGDTVLSGIENANHVLDGVYVLVDNGGASPITVTVNGIGYTVPDAEMHALPANRGVYPGQSVAVTYSAVTSVTVGAFRT